MINAKSFVCADFGAGTLKVAEFEINDDGGLRLLQFGEKALGIAGAQDAARERVVNRAFGEILGERPVGSKVFNACAPGFHVFSKFVKLPPVDSGKITQIIQYEAQQNVPFPLEEVVWDYQVLGRAASGEMEVLLVAIKTDIVEGLFKSAETQGFRVNLIDASQAALTNAFRYSYHDMDGCSMLLDIGAKTSNVLFFEGEKVYARSINIGANSITQEFAANVKMPFAEAEKFKVAEGFVSLGGAYAEPEDPNLAAISKISRQVMTRLHIQVNQTIQFYRGQQGGSAPQRLLVAGGASVMPYATQFFAEKLEIEVDYFNPFRSVEIDPSIDLEELASVAHSFGEVVGVGLRSAAECPVELNLVPKTAIKRQQFNQKKPWLVAAVLSVIAIVFVLGLFNGKMAAMAREAVEDVNRRTGPIASVDSQISSENRKLTKSKTELEEIGKILGQRFFWGDLVSEIRDILMQTEQEGKAALGVETGVWIESFQPDLPDEPKVDLYDSKGPEKSEDPYAGMDAEMMARYGLTPDSGAGASDPYGGGGGDPYGAGGGDPYGTGSGGGASGPVDTNSVSSVTISCRAINMTHSPSANIQLINILQNKLQASASFDEKETKLTGSIERVPPEQPDFGFEVLLKLSQPIKLQ